MGRRSGTGGQFADGRGVDLDREWRVANRWRTASAWFYAMSQAGILINVVLMVLNLFPLPPLDGGRIAVSLLPHPYAYRLARIEPYGMIILVVLLISGVLAVLLGPFVFYTRALLLFLFGS